MSDQNLPPELSGFAATQVLGLFDALPDVYLFVKDRESRFVKVNAAWLALHGLTSDAEALGTNDYDYHPPALAAQYVAEDQRVMRSGRPLRDQAWLVADHTGLPQWYLCTKLPLVGPDGGVAGIAGVLRPFDHAGHAPDEYRRLTPVLEHVVANYRRRLPVNDLARRSGLSPSQLQREFRRLFNMTVGDYILRLRLLMARKRLRATTDAVGRIATDCGFYDQAHFTRAFKQHTGQTPLEYRRGQGSHPADAPGTISGGTRSRPARRKHPMTPAVQPVRRPPPTGFTLVELLVVIAIIGVLVALLLPAVQSARESGRRIACSNSMRQVAQAVHLAADAMRFLPPMAAPSSSGTITMAAPPFNGYVGFTAFTFLLPFIEQSPLYDIARKNVNTPVAGAPGQGTVVAVAVPTFLCPSDSSDSNGMSATTSGGANKWAVGNFAANYNVFGNVLGTTPAARAQGRSRLTRSFPDGTSKVVMLAERYGTCGLEDLNDGDVNDKDTRGSLWCDSNSWWRPVFCANSFDPSLAAQDRTQLPQSTGYTTCGMFQVAPQFLRECDSSVAQTPHPTAMNTALADGSVRSIAGDISASTWADVCNPADGRAVGNDW